MFGWKQADGTRLIREVYIEVPRKNGKTEFAAGLSILLLLADGEFGGQGYALAADEDQAGIVFRKAGTMVGFSEDLGRDIEVLKTALYVPELQASFKPLSSSPHTKHGFSPSFSVADETHAWKNGDLATVVHQGTGARRQPLEITITTAGIKGDNYGWELHDRAVKLIDGTLVDPHSYAVIFAAEPDDDWTDEAVWQKANPNYGVSPKVAYFRSEFAKAIESPRRQNEFRRYHLNQWTEQVTRWLDLAQWDACVGPVAWQKLREHLKGRFCHAAFDLSTKIDVTALVEAFEPRDGIDEPWFLLPTFFLPRDNLKKRMDRDRLPYDRWAAEGALILTEGNVIDYGFIEHRLAEDAKQFEIVDCAYDPWSATQTALRLQDSGLTMVEFGQGYKSMSEPSKELESLIIATRLAHGGHPMLREMAKAVSVATDPAGNIKPDKSKANLRIDGIVASVMAIGRSLTGEKPFRSVYETRGIVTV